VLGSIIFSGKYIDENLRKIHPEPLVDVIVTKDGTCVCFLHAPSGVCGVLCTMYVCKIYGCFVTHTLFFCFTRSVGNEKKIRLVFRNDKLKKFETNKNASLRISLFMLLVNIRIRCVYVNVHTKQSTHASCVTHTSRWKEKRVRLHDFFGWRSSY